MTETQYQAALSAESSFGARSGIPFGRLVHVELRKQLDTRAGRWLLITIAVVTCTVMTGTALLSSNPSYGTMLVGAVAPLGLLLPVVGILSATSEWSQRTALVTFSLEPRRLRVSLAKLASAVLTGAGLFLGVCILGLLGHLFSSLATGSGLNVSVNIGVVTGSLLVIVIGMAQGIAIGSLLANTPAAIVVFYVAPSAMSLVSGLLPSLHQVLPWIDITSATAPLLLGVSSLPIWARLATSTVFWVVLPFIGGVIRTTRTDV